MNEEDRPNPFLVLGVLPSASRTEVERAGQRLLALLTIGAESARTFETARGPMVRDESAVRLALAELRDPSRRLRHEIWLEAEPTSNDAPSDDVRFEGALDSIGWRMKCPTSSSFSRSTR